MRSNLCSSSRNEEIKLSASSDMDGIGGENCSKDLLITEGHGRPTQRLRHCIILLGALNSGCGPACPSLMPPACRASRGSRVEASMTLLIESSDSGVRFATCEWVWSG